MAPGVGRDRDVESRPMGNPQCHGGLNDPMSGPGQTTNQATVTMLWQVPAQNANWCVVDRDQDGVPRVQGSKRILVGPVGVDHIRVDRADCFFKVPAFLLKKIADCMIGPARSHMNGEPITAEYDLLGEC